MSAREVVANKHETHKETFLVIDHGTGTGSFMLEHTNGEDEYTSLSTRLTYENRLALIRALNNVKLNCFELHFTTYQSDIELREREFLGAYGTRELALTQAKKCADAYNSEYREIGNEVVMDMGNGLTYVWTLSITAKDGYA